MMSLILLEQLVGLLLYLHTVAASAVIISRQQNKEFKSIVLDINIVFYHSSKQKFIRLVPNWLNVKYQ